MGKRDRLLQTVQAVHAAGLEADLWPQALAAITRTVGGVAATLETFDRPAAQIVEFHSHGLPPACEMAYFDDYAMRNPRIPMLTSGRPGEVTFDYMVLDERAMDRDVFYADFLAPEGYRYCIGGTLAVLQRESSLVSVQRLKKQGHVQRREVETMKALLPHIRQAYDVTRRLRDAASRQYSLEKALECMTAGAGLVGGDGRLLFANAALRGIARRGDGIRIGPDGRFGFSARDAERRYRRALASASHVSDGGVRLRGGCDFPVSRGGGLPPYLVSLRPLARRGQPCRAGSARMIAFVNDPALRECSSAELLREIFGLTAAETCLARAMQAGVSPAGYARANGLSHNTVYTHLRRVKDKTGCRTQAALVARLNEIVMPVRPD